MSDDNQTDVSDGDLNAAAQALGRMGKGVPKKLSDEERAKRAERMRAVTAKRVTKRVTMHLDKPWFDTTENVWKIWNGEKWVIKPQETTI